MPSIYTYEIGAINIALIPDSGEYNFYNTERFDSFLSSSEAVVNLRISSSIYPQISSGEQVFDTNVNWHLYRDDNKWVIFLRTSTEGEGIRAEFESDFHSGHIYTHRMNTQSNEYFFPLNNPLGKLFFVNLMAQGYGVMLHSCGLTDAGKGLVFAGYGGAGKSTTARIWDRVENIQVLNDDCIIVRKMLGKYFIFGTPWPGMGGNALPDSAPLDKIFILRQATHNESRQLSPVAAASALLARAFAPHWDASAMDFTLRFLSDLCQQVPVYELSFLPDKSIVEYVRCL